MKPPKFGNCSVDDLGSMTIKTGITFEDFKLIFQEETPRESAMQKLEQN